MEVKKSWKVCEGLLQQCVHPSTSTGTNMTFSVFTPAASSKEAPVPMVMFLSGLTCTDENFSQKAGAFRSASKFRLALVIPDTSPRGANIPGFYVNATQEPWSKNYKMYQYITEELPQLVQEHFPIDINRASIMGHSIGGHGALIIAMKNPQRFQSVSAFSPVCNPINGPWGIKAFTGYLGEDRSTWNEYDATQLMQTNGPFSFPILIDQGTADEFYKQKQLLPEVFRDVCEAKYQSLALHMREGYDHSYFFISTFVDNHLEFHAQRLNKP